MIVVIDSVTHIRGRTKWVAAGGPLFPYIPDT
jgi:hypothetical protein